MRFFLHGPRTAAEPTCAGYKLVVVMRGGNGGVAFQPMVRRLLNYAMTEEFIVAEPVALSQDVKIIWPHALSRPRGDRHQRHRSLPRTSSRQ